MISALSLIFAIAVIEATSVEDSPLEKVLSMLGDLQAEVITEGKAEAETYDKFACFCKDVMEEKSKAITENTDTKDTIQADIETESTKRDELDTSMAELTKRLGEIEGEIKEAMDKRHAEKLTYDKNVLDMEGALQAIESAIETLKSSKDALGLLQAKSMVTNVRKATLMADALGLGNPKTLKALSAMFMQEKEVPSEVYEFQSQEIIELLEKLLKDFKDGKSGIDEEEVKAVDAHDKVIEALEKEKESKTKELEDAKSDKAAAQELIAEKSGELSTISATLLDDQEYLKDLAAKCDEKAKAWDQRTSARSDELSAITQAVSIIKGLQKEDFIQIQATKQVLPAGKHTAQEKDVAVHLPLGFLQLESKPHLAAISSKQSETASQGEKRDALVSLLRSEAKTLKSGLLAKLAQRVAADPFAKIKKLIQELIERLLQEAADEASHKGWCDKEMGKAKQTRGWKVEELEKLNAGLATAEALRDKLTEEKDDLTADIESLGQELTNSTELRDKEKEENEATIKEAKEAKEAVGEAIKVLKDFYNKEGFLQDPEAPDAGFEGEYKGKGDKAGGIIGMLEVVQSDFARTEKETTEAEDAAAKDFIEFERTTKVSKKTKEIALEATSSHLKETEDKVSTDKETMTSTQTALDNALLELQKLHDACIDTGKSAEEKKMQREQELESLKKALCILDKQGPVQTEDC